MYKTHSSSKTICNSYGPYILTMKQKFAHLILCVLFSLHDDTNEKIYPISCLHPYNEHCIRLKSIKNNDLAEFNWKHYRKDEIPNLKFIIRNKIFEILNTHIESYEIPI